MREKAFYRGGKKYAAGIALFLGVLLFFQPADASGIPREIRNINTEINRIPYVSDLKNCGEKDCFRGIDFFLRHGGDCEDYALVKARNLAMTGNFSYRQMRLVRGHITAGKHKGEAHAVLEVKDGEKEYWLDNLHDEVTEQPVNFEILR